MSQEISEKNGTPREVGKMDKETIRAVMEAVRKAEFNIVMKNDDVYGLVDRQILLAELQKLIDSPSTEEE